MDHWQMSDLDRYRNPSRPVTPNDAPTYAVTTVHTGAHRESTYFAYERRPTHQLPQPDHSFGGTRWNTTIQNLATEIKTEPVQGKTDTVFFEPRSPNLIDFEDSDEEKATSQSTKTSKEPRKDTARLKRYHARYIKLSHNYTKLQKRHEDLKAKREKNAKELKETQEQTLKKSSELLVFQAKIGERDAQLELKDGKIRSLQKELDLERSKNSNIEGVMQVNRHLAKRVEDLEAALKQLMIDQYTIFNVQKELLEKSQDVYQHIFLK